MRAFSWILTAALVSLGMATPGVALADSEVYLWGVGGRVGTIAIPGRYPSSFPGAVNDDGGFDKVKGDIILGAEGLYWADKHSRIVVDLGAGLGSGYSDYHLMVKYHRMEPTSALDYFYGGGIGVGTSSFTDGTQRALRVPNYPLRGEGGLMVRDNPMAYQAMLFVQVDIPGSSEYTDASGAVQEVGWGFYGQIGVELALFYGDFKPPKKKKKTSSSSSSKSKSSKSKSSK